MEEYIIPGIVGVLLIIMGIGNTKGNISTLHWYHRQRVSEADRVPFGRLVGFGTILIGIAIVVFSVLLFATERSQNPIYVTVGSTILVVSIIVGLGISFYAMIKYNKGIF